MTSNQLLEATLDARKRHLQGVGLATLLLVIDTPQTLGDIAMYIGVAAPTITGVAKTLKRHGYITTTASAADHRKRYIEITQKGIATTEAILQEL